MAALSLKAVRAAAPKKSGTALSRLNTGSIDLAEDILGVVEAVDIVLWPVAMDFKKKDIEAMPDKAIVATLLNGAIRTSEQEEMARLLRRKSQYLIDPPGAKTRSHSYWFASLIPQSSWASAYSLSAACGGEGWGEVVFPSKFNVRC